MNLELLPPRYPSATAGDLIYFGFPVSIWHLRPARTNADPVAWPILADDLGRHLTLLKVTDVGVRPGPRQNGCYRILALDRVT